jgi:cytochrome c oxidase cbb3-type subunit III
MQKRAWLLITSLLASALLFAAQDADTLVPPDYPEALINSGREQFISHCGFCHGRDAMGGSQGLDLTRSELVANDANGELINEVLQTGRPDQGMPPFPQLDANSLAAITAFMKTQTYIAATADGGRRSVLPEDLLVGNAELGQVYFGQHCTACHSASGDLAGIGQREGLGLLMNMLYPRQAARSSATVIVTNGEAAIRGTLAYRDEFTVALRDANGIYRSFSTDRVSYHIEDPLDAHIEQLARYTDQDMHDVYAYLRSLR